ncbi:MAG: flagellar basal-body rod protein FlgG [Lachnospiraceae bacterium]
MVRSLWTGATGMNAQQTNLDTIANNLANVNTVGYKSETAEFKTLLYQNLQAKTTLANGEEKPTSAQVGLGTRLSSITSVFSQGSLTASDSDTAFAISGDGFFGVRNTDGTINYTRNGNFLFTTASNGGMMLSTTDGLPVVNSTGQPIILTGTYNASKITVSTDGKLYYPDANNNPQEIGMQIGIYQFTNPSGLEKLGSTLYAATDASGAAINEATNANVNKSSLVQGYLEASNVQVADEMVNLIVAQRAYEMNSKIITTTDEMMQQANQLKR